MRGPPRVATAVAGLLERLFGEPVADALRAPRRCEPSVACWTRRALTTRSRDAGGDSEVRIDSIVDVYRRERLDPGGQIDDWQFELLVTEAAEVLQPFVQSDGSVAFDMPAHIVTVTKH